ncbi:hypothetical protein SAMN05428978_104016 [Nitrosomonas sp. Nm34]|nr:hypothetical protein SAMN05428978_104016 [Nitrosomonas sp. Nm34]
MIQSLLAKKNPCGVSLFIRTMIPVDEYESSSEVALGLSRTRSALSSVLGPSSAHGMAIPMPALQLSRGGRLCTCQRQFAPHLPWKFRRAGPGQQTSTILASRVRNYLGLKLTLPLLQKQDIHYHPFHASSIIDICRPLH